VLEDDALPDLETGGVPSLVCTLLVTAFVGELSGLEFDGGDESRCVLVDSIETARYAFSSFSRSSTSSRS
jgi:hypothetical protein